MAKNTTTNWGFDTKTIDAVVRPQDDFYRYANGAWLKKEKIPETEANWGSFTILRYNTEHQLQTIVEDLSKKTNYKKGSPEQLVADMFRSGTNLKSREKLGTLPIAPLQEEIKNISSKEELLYTLAHFDRIGISVPWGTYVDQDAKNSLKYALHFAQSGLGLPDRDYYLKNDAEFMRVKEAYAKHLLRMFGLLGYTQDEAEEKAGIVLKIETRLAKASMDKVDVRDADKTYHKKTLKELQSLTPTIPWKTYFKESGIPVMPYYIVGQPNFLKESEKMINTVPLQEWKVYLEWNLADSAAPFLTKKFVETNFEFYGKVLSGVTKLKPNWRRTLRTVNGALGDALGQIYVKKHFPAEAKKKMDLLVDDLFAAYAERIKKLDWMTPATKKKALKKLSMVSRKIGYPRKWKSYKGLVIIANDYFGNIMRATEHAHNREMRKLQGAIDRDEWFMSPQTVNAYHHSNLNDIAFPAAILQPPFFNLSADDAVNYAAIGSVIGHELTHGFDDNGAKFDGYGNLKNWWTPTDKKKFEAKGKLLAKQFDTYVVADGVHVNGNLTLGENIADLGGLVIAWKAYQTRLQKTGRTIINGLTPEARFFFGFAQQERELTRPEAQKTRVLTDPHSPAEFRINGPVSNFEPFYEIYNIKPGDKLYREPKNRAKIW